MRKQSEKGFEGEEGKKEWRGTLRKLNIKKLKMEIQDPARQKNIFKLKD